MTTPTATGPQAPGPVRLQLLGGFAVRVARETAPDDRWRLRKAKTLVKLLALAPGRRMHRDVLVEALWPDVDPAAQANNLHQALHAARRGLGGRRDGVTLIDGVVTLPADVVSSDVATFEALAERARRTGERADLRAAVEAYVGDLLPEDLYADWVQPHRERLREEYSAVLLSYARSLIAGGEADAAASLLRQSTSDRPTDEPLHLCLMEALAASGRRWEAIEVYERLRQQLDEQLAATPGPATRAFHRSLLTNTPATTARPAAHLPAATTSFVGRRRQLGALASMTDRSRLITLTGPGGAGKTRLAAELGASRDVSAAQPDGVWFVSLADVRGDGLVVSTVAAALGVVLTGDELGPRTLASHLRSRRQLIVLDNCEHLLNECARVVGTLLSECPGLRFVATSREPLGVPGEVNWRVPSLDLPEADDIDDLASLASHESVALFVDRAREATPGFTLDEQTAAAVVQICRRLDGMPLALELAAARLAHLSVAEIAARLGDALALLDHRAAGRLDRQQTLRATLDWSHDLLDDVERAVFRQTAVFAGGFDLESLTQVCEIGGDAIDALSRLVDKSLVIADTSGDSARYSLLEVVRQYAAQKLSDADELRRIADRHGAWFTRCAEARDPEIVGFELDGARWFRTERDNLRAALASALEREPDRALRLAVSLWRWWMTSGSYAEGTAWLQRAMSAGGGDTRLRRRALFGAAVLDTRLALSEDLPGYADRLVALTDHEPATDRVRALQQRALLSWVVGEWVLAHERAHDAGVLASSLASAEDLAGVEHLLALIALGRFDHAAATAHVEKCLEWLCEVPVDGPAFFTPCTVAHLVDTSGPVTTTTFEETLLLGRHVGLASARGYAEHTRAWVLRELHRHDDALAALELARSSFSAARDSDGEAMAVAFTGNTLRAKGDVAGARAALERSLQLRESFGDVRGIALSLSGLALVAAIDGDHAAARRLTDRVADLVGRAGDMSGWYAVHAMETTLAVGRGDLEAAAAAAHRGAMQRPGPGSHRATSWLGFARAQCLARLQRPADAAAALEPVRVEFARQDAGPALQLLDEFAKQVQSIEA